VAIWIILCSSFSGFGVTKSGELLDSVAFDDGGISKSVDWQGGGEFIYFELDKYNQKYIDKLNAIKRGHGTAKTIEQLYDEINKHAFTAISSI
jgi:adenine-specific DNA-methyltransferase